MRVLLSTYGSRGDVEPIIALGLRLKALGVEARVSAPTDDEFVRLAERAGVPLMPAFMPIRRWIAEKRREPTHDIARFAAEMAPAQFDVLNAAAEGCDAILATGLFPSAGAAHAVAERRGVPYFHVSFCPLFIPSPHHRPYAFPGRPLPEGETDHQALWEHNARTFEDLFGGALNALRKGVGLPPLGAVRDAIFTDRPLLAADPVVGPWRPTGLDVAQTGAWILPDERPLPAALDAFLDAGPPPVYVGFGSMAMAGSPDVAWISAEAARAHARRIVVARGWADPTPGDGADDVLVVGDVNQQALFPRVAAVVHHGGAGTTTAAARAGAPQVIVPQVADQPHWAGRIADLGAGAAHGGATPTLASLTAALDVALAPETRDRANVLSGMVRADGAGKAARLLINRCALQS